MILSVLLAKEMKDIINTGGIKEIYKNLNQNIKVHVSSNTGLKIYR